MLRGLFLACVCTCLIYSVTSVDPAPVFEAATATVRYTPEELLVYRCHYVIAINRNAQRAIFCLHLWQPRCQRQQRRRRRQQKRRGRSPCALHGPTDEYGPSVVHVSTVAYESSVTQGSSAEYGPSTVHCSSVVH